MQDEGIPDNDQEGAIFFRIPTPETPPRLIGPYPTQNRAYELNSVEKQTTP